MWIDININTTTVVSRFSLMLSTRQASEDDRYKHWNKISKITTFWNFMTIFGITIANAFRRVQTSLVLVH